MLVEFVVWKIKMQIIKVSSVLCLHLIIEPSSPTFISFRA